MSMTSVFGSNGSMSSGTKRKRSADTMLFARIGVSTMMKHGGGAALHRLTVACKALEHADGGLTRNGLIYLNEDTDTVVQRALTGQDCEVIQPGDGGVGNKVVAGVKSEAFTLYWPCFVAVLSSCGSSACTDFEQRWQKLCLHPPADSERSDLIKLRALIHDKIQTIGVSPATGSLTEVAEVPTQPTQPVMVTAQPTQQALSLAEPKTLYEKYQSNAATREDETAFRLAAYELELKLLAKAFKESKPAIPLLIGTEAVPIVQGRRVFAIGTFNVPTASGYTAFLAEYNGSSCSVEHEDLIVGLMKKSEGYGARKCFEYKTYSDSTPAHKHEVFIRLLQYRENAPVRFHANDKNQNRNELKQYQFFGKLSNGALVEISEAEYTQLVDALKPVF